VEIARMTVTHWYDTVRSAVRKEEYISVHVDQLSYSLPEPHHEMITFCIRLYEELVRAVIGTGDMLVVKPILVLPLADTTEIDANVPDVSEVYDLPHPHGEPPALGLLSREAEKRFQIAERVQRPFHIREDLCVPEAVIFAQYVCCRYGEYVVRNWEYGRQIEIHAYPSCLVFCQAP
jgi:hypothetical protein